MASIFKSLSPNDYSIVPFPAYYKYSYSYTSGSTNNSQDVTLAYGYRYNSQSIEIRLPNVQQELYDSVIQTFYSPIPYATYGTTSESYIPSGSVYVVSIAQDIFGEKVLPGSFTITVAGTKSYDDSHGNLIASSSGTGSIIGRIFYDKGVALLKPTSSITGGGMSKNGIFIPSGSSAIIQFSSSVLLYENYIKAKLAPTDFLYALNNPTVISYVTSSVSGAATVTTDLAINLMMSHSMKPYVTTLGFYNEDNELLLVAKPSVPVQRTSDVMQTFIVKFDI